MIAMSFFQVETSWWQAHRRFDIIARASETSAAAGARADHLDHHFGSSPARSARIIASAAATL